MGSEFDFIRSGGGAVSLARRLRGGVVVAGMETCVVRETVRARLGGALCECRAAIGEYQSGVIDESEMRRRLIVHGVIDFADEIWILDLDAGRWCRFDGVSVCVGRSPFDRLRFDHWRIVIDRLAGQLQGEVG